MLLKSIKMLRLFHDFKMAGVIALWAVSVVLVVWCDIALITEVRKVRRLQKLPRFGVDC